MTTQEADYYRLRTEWLRYRSHLFDTITGLPTLPAVVEDVRRLLESRGGVDVLYVDLGRSGMRETTLGWAAYDEAVRDFATRVGALSKAGIMGLQDLVCLQTVRSDRFIFFLVSGTGDPAAGATRRERLLAALRDGGDGHPGAVPAVGAQLAVGRATIRPEPMIRSERAIQQAVADAVAASLAQREEKQEGRRAALARMIDSRGVRAVFHPIVRLSDGGIIGHEALTRPKEASAFASVEELFAFAETTELLVGFERLCRETAIRSASGISSRGLLFLNACARAMEDPEWGDGTIETMLRDCGLAPGDIVVEITERLAVADHEGFRAALSAFKRRGYRVAVDDMGAGYASLRALAEIEPDFLKFDVSLVQDIDRSNIKRSLLESLKTLADKIHARVIAEGVEREGERQTLLKLGIELGQGFYFHPES